MVLLDHLTRGRVMFGVGPGALPSDAFMMGIDPAKQRDMMEESLEAILPLLAGETGHHGDGVVQAGQGPPAAAALPAPLPRGRRGGAGVAGRAPGRRALRLQPALHRGHLGRRLRRPGPPLGRHGGAGRRVLAPPSTAAGGAWSGRCTSPTPRSRPWPTWPSAWTSGSTTSNGWPPCRWPRTPRTSSRWSTPSTPRASPSSARSTTPSRRSSGCRPAVRGLRHLPAHGPRVGRHRRHPPLLRAHRPLRGAPTSRTPPASLTASRDWAAENRPEFIGAAGNAVMSAIQKHQEEKQARETAT